MVIDKTAAVYLKIMVSVLEFNFAKFTKTSLSFESLYKYENFFKGYLTILVLYAFI